MNRHSGFTANKLMLGREANTSASLMYRPPHTQCAYETARRRLNTSEERMKRDFDLKAVIRPFEEGDLVYMLDTATVKGKCQKLSQS